MPGGIYTLLCVLAVTGVGSLARGTVKKLGLESSSSYVPPTATPGTFQKLSVGPDFLAIFLTGNKCFIIRLAFERLPSFFCSCSRMEARKWKRPYRGAFKASRRHEIDQNNEQHHLSGGRTCLSSENKSSPRRIHNTRGHLLFWGSRSTPGRKPRFHATSPKR